MSGTLAPAWTPTGMDIVIVILIFLLLFGGGGGWGYSHHYLGADLPGILYIIAVIVAAFYVIRWLQSRRGPPGPPL